MDSETGVGADAPRDRAHQQEDAGADARSAPADRDRCSLGSQHPADLQRREDLSTLAVDVDMEFDLPAQRSSGGIAALESLLHQTESGSVDPAAEFHREGACRRLGCSLSTGVAALEFPPSRRTRGARMRVRLRGMRWNGAQRRKQCAAQRDGEEGPAQFRWERRCARVSPLAVQDDRGTYREAEPGQHARDVHTLAARLRMFGPHAMAAPRPPFVQVERVVEGGVRGDRDDETQGPSSARRGYERAPGLQRVARISSACEGRPIHKRADPPQC